MSQKTFRRKSKKHSKTRKNKKQHKLYRKIVGGNDLLEPEKNIEFQIGKKIFNDYYEIQVLGEGSFGKVYKAKNQENNGVYAVKVININPAKVDEFTNEINILNILKPVCNENVICYETSLRVDLTGYIVTEFLDNYVSLSEYLSTNQILNTINEFLVNPTHESRFVKLISDLCEGVDAMHSMSVAHRDIKPDNVLINRDTWKIKYIDFGFACYVEDDPFANICLKSLGTANYFDPLLAQYYPMVNQKLNNRKLSKADFYEMNKKHLLSSDLWSLGIMICVVMTKMVPYTIITKKYEDLKMSNLKITPEMAKNISHHEKLYKLYPFYIQNFALKNDAMKKYLTISDMIFELSKRANRTTGEAFYCARLTDLLSLDMDKRIIYTPID